MTIVPPSAPPTSDGPAATTGERAYYSIAQAAALLGVSRVSIWRWIRAGDLPVARLGHRTVRIKRQDLDRLLVAGATAGSRAWAVRGQGPGAGAAPDVGAAGTAQAAWWTVGASDGASAHAIQFYEADAALLDAVAAFIGAPLRTGDAGIVIATQAHRAGLEDRLRAAGLDVDGARASGRYVALDAADLLARLMVGGAPEPARFRAVVGDLIARAADGQRRVHCFGEIVALLAVAGNPAAAVRLEELWNDLQQVHAFTLYCAYPLACLAGEDGGVLREICAAHATVLPAESYTALPRGDARQRAIVGLQHKARALEAEIAARTRVEQELRQRARQAELAAEIGVALTDRDALPAQLQRCAAAVVRHLDAAFARIWTLDAAEGMLVLQASAGVYTHLDGPHSRVPLGALKNGRIAAERRPHRTNRVVGDPAISDQDWARREGMVAFAGYPLSVGDRVVGVLALFARHALPEAALAVLGSIADEIALGIARAWADEERTQLLAAAQAARLEAEAARDRVQQVLDALPAGVVLVDAAGRVTMRNVAATALCGPGLSGSPVPVDGSAATGTAAACRLDGTPYPAEELPLQRALGRGEVVHGAQFLAHTADGAEIPVLADGVPLRDAAGAISGAVAVFQDITPLRELERAREEFLSSAAHDLKTPLTSIRGLAQLARRRLSRLTASDSGRPVEQDTAPLMAQMEGIEAATARMARLIDTVSDLTRTRLGAALELERRPVDLVALVGAVVARFAGQSPHRITLATEAPTLTLALDAERIERVVDNLLSNAVKYSPAGGDITVHVAREDGADGPAAVLAVRDQGLGIAAADLPHVFARFHRAADVRGHIAGTGIGLASVAQIVHQHGGSVAVASQEGAGATFTVRLPLAAALAPPPVPADGAGGGARP